MDDRRLVDLTTLLEKAVQQWMGQQRSFPGCVRVTVEHIDGERHNFAIAQDASKLLAAIDARLDALAEMALDMGKLAASVGDWPRAQRALMAWGQMKR